MAQDKITSKQQEILEYIKETILQKGYPPAVREICEAVHLNPPLPFTPICPLWRIRATYGVTPPNPGPLRFWTTPLILTAERW